MWGPEKAILSLSCGRDALRVLLSIAAPAAPFAGGLPDVFQVSCFL